MKEEQVQHNPMVHLWQRHTDSVVTWQCNFFYFWERGRSFTTSYKHWYFLFLSLSIRAYLQNTEVCLCDCILSYSVWSEHCVKIQRWALKSIYLSGFFVMCSCTVSKRSVILYAFCLVPKVTVARKCTWTQFSSLPGDKMFFLGHRYRNTSYT